MTYGHGMKHIQNMKKCNYYCQVGIAIKPRENSIAFINFSKKNGGIKDDTI